MHNCIYALTFFHGFISILGITFCPPCEEWLDKAIKLQCRSQNKVYVCMLDGSNQTQEKCIDDLSIKNGTGGCPFINVRENDPDSVVIPHRDAYHKCPEEKTGCPPKYHGGYKLSEICKYPGCTQRRPCFTDNTPKAHTNPSSDSHTTNSYEIYEIKKDKWKPIILSVLGGGLSITIVVVACIIVYKRKQKRRVDKGKLFSHKQSKYKGIECKDSDVDVEACALEYKESDVESSDANTCALEYKNSDVDNSDTDACSLVYNGKLSSRKQNKYIHVEIGSPTSQVVRSGNFKLKKSHLRKCKELEVLLSKCEYQEFDKKISEYYLNGDVDLKCDLNSLRLHGEIFQGNCYKTEKDLDDLMNMCKKSTYPLFFESKFLSARGRYYVNSREKDKLKSTNDTLFQTLAFDSSLLEGRQAGWMHFNQCRYYKEEIRQIQVSDEKTVKYVEQCFQSAMGELSTSIQYFHNEDSKEARHGEGIAILEMVTLLLRWPGKEKLESVEINNDDLSKCERYFTKVEFELGVSLLTDVELNLQSKKAKCMYAIRTKSLVAANDYLSEFSKLVANHKRDGMLPDVDVLTKCMESLKRT